MKKYSLYFKRGKSKRCEALGASESSVQKP